MWLIWLVNSSVESNSTLEFCLQDLVLDSGKLVLQKELPTPKAIRYIPEKLPNLFYFWSEKNVFEASSPFNVFSAELFFQINQKRNQKLRRNKKYGGPDKGGKRLRRSCFFQTGACTIKLVCLLWRVQNNTVGQQPLLPIIKAVAGWLVVN